MHDADSGAADAAPIEPSDSGLGPNVPDAASESDGGACDGLVARRIWAEDFEGDPQATLNGAEIIEHESCAGGARCARVNLTTGREDPLLDAPGRNGATVEVGELPLDGPETRGVVITHDFRFDDAWWRGPTFENPEPDSTRVVLKAGYYGMRIDGTPWTETSFYLVLGGGEGGTVNIGDNGGDRDAIPWRGWSQRTYGWRNGGGAPTGLSYMSTGSPFGADGEWHRLELEVRYLAGGDHHLAQVRIDGVAATGRNAPEGWFALPPEYAITRYSTSYTNSTNTSGSEDRGGHACGMQIDDMRVAQLVACEP